MSHLVQSIILCLLAAIALGFILGWLLRAMVAKPVYVERHTANLSSGSVDTSADHYASHAGQASGSSSPDTSSHSSRGSHGRRSDFIFVDR